VAEVAGVERVAETVAVTVHERARGRAAAVRAVGAPIVALLRSLDHAVTAGGEHREAGENDAADGEAHECDTPKSVPAHGVSRCKNGAACRLARGATEPGKANEREHRASAVCHPDAQLPAAWACAVKRAPHHTRAIARSRNQYPASEPMPYTGARRAHPGMRRVWRPAARPSASTPRTNSTCPTSIPALKERSASGISPAGSPASRSAAAKPRPWRSPKAAAIVHGRRRTRVGAAGRRASSTASARMLAAIATSITRDGKSTMPSAASVSVMLCPSVNALT